MAAVGSMGWGSQAWLKLSGMSKRCSTQNYCWQQLSCGGYHCSWWQRCQRPCRASLGRLVNRWRSRENQPSPALAAALAEPGRLDHRKSHEPR